MIGERSVLDRGGITGLSNPLIQNSRTRELFARNPDLMDLDEGSHLTPIPTMDDLCNLSAILLDDEYYHFVIGHGLIL